MPNPLETLTLRDLENWDRRDEAGNFLPSLAVLGHPVSHSVSPQMHNAALAYLVEQGHKKLKDWQYFKFDIEPEHLGKAFELLPKKNFKGTNLTVPLKGLAAILCAPPMLNNNPAGQEKFYISSNAMSAVNTVVFSEKRAGFNTDGFGMVMSLKNDLQVSIEGRTVVILGVGGAATEVADECIRKKCAVLWVGSRDEQKRTLLKNRVDQHIHELLKIEPLREIKVYDFDFFNPPTRQWPDNVIIINATTLGMNRDDQVPLDVKPLGNRACVMDMVYNKSGPTKLVKEARARDLRAADGLGMLIWQGAKSLSIWIKAHEGIEIKPESIAQTMMNAACFPLGLPPRHA